MTGVGGNTVTSAFVVEQMPRAVHIRAVTRWTPALSEVAGAVATPEPLAGAAREPQTSAPSTRKPDERSEPSSHTRKLETSIGSDASLGAKRNTTTGLSVGIVLPGGGWTSASAGARLRAVSCTVDDTPVVWQEADRETTLDNNASVVVNAIDAAGSALHVNTGEHTFDE